MDYKAVKGYMSVIGPRPILQKELELVVKRNGAQ